MKNFYNITKEQLITLWAFAIFFAFYANGTYNDILDALSITLLFGTLFYTFGWKNYHKVKSE